MSGDVNRTNPILLFLCAALSLGSSWILTESTSAPFVSDATESIDMYVTVASGEPEETAMEDAGIPEETLQTEPEQAAGEAPVEEIAAPQAPEEAVPEETQAPELTVAGNVQMDFEVRQETPYEVSPEASQGAWIPYGTGWMFFIDGAAYSGWLNDLDGKRYYLGSDGLMSTGWLEEHGARYYLDADGIMQTGQVEIDGTTYTFEATGVLKTE